MEVMLFVVFVIPIDGGIESALNGWHRSS
jgi:hypothetical protein